MKRYFALLFALAWLAALVLLGLGLWLPAIRIVRMRLFAGEYSLLGTVGLLWQTHQWFLALLIGLFTVVTPALKLVVLGWLWAIRHRAMTHAWRMIGVIDTLGKWSMLDVLVVAILVVTLQGGFWVRAQPRAGLWLFAAATLLTMLMSSLARRLMQPREPAPPP